MATATLVKPRDIPAVSPTVEPAIRDPLVRVREEVQRLLGFVGVDRLDMAVTWRQLAEQGFVDLDRINSPSRGVPGSIIVPGGSVNPERDLTPADDPTGLNVVAGFSFVTAEWDTPIYTQGHGHGQTNVYAVKRPIPDPNPPPVFADAALISNEFAPTTIASYPSEMRTRWHVWIKWQTVDGVESINPAGGTNGFQVDTGEDVTQLLDALTTAALTPGGPYSKVIFRTDLFAIAPELDFYEETTPTGTVVGQLWGVPSTGVIKTWDGDSWEAFSAPLPFVVNTSPITEDGVSIPAGVYMDAAYIRNLSAMTARFGTAVIDGATIANLDASIINAGFLDADRIDVGTLTADKLSVTELAAITANMGAITAGSIDLNTSGFIRGGQTGYDTGTGFWLGYSGAFKFSIGNSAGNKLTWDGTTLSIVGGGTFSGALSAATGTFAGALAAATGTFGAVTIATGGSLSSGQTAYNTGTGFWLGLDGGTPKFSIGNSAGVHMKWTGTALEVNQATFEAFSASISGGDLTVTGQNAAAYDSYGSRTVTATGGKSPYAYTWIVQQTGQDSYLESRALLVAEAGTNTDTLTVGGWANGVTVYGTAVCLVRDANGRTTTASFNISAEHDYDSGGGA